MTEEHPVQILLRDPLRDVTRKERRYLLGISIISIAIVKAGLVPSKISALGIEFTKTNEQALLWILAGVVFYFFCAFLIYGVSDFLAWRRDLRVSMEEGFKKFVEQEVGKKKDKVKILLEDPDIKKRFRMPNTFPYLRRPASLIRGIFDFFVPIAVGLFAVVSLLNEILCS